MAYEKKYIVFETERWAICDCDFAEQCYYSHEFQNLSNTSIRILCETNSVEEALACFKIDPFNRIVWDFILKRRSFAVTAVSEIDRSRHCVMVQDTLEPCGSISKFMLPFYDILQDIGDEHLFPQRKYSESFSGQSRKRITDNISAEMLFKRVKSEAKAL